MIVIHQARVIINISRHSPPSISRRADSQLVQMYWVYTLPWKTGRSGYSLATTQCMAQTASSTMLLKVTEQLLPLSMTIRWHWTGGWSEPSLQLAICSLEGQTTGLMVMLVFLDIWLVVMFLYETRIRQRELGREAVMLLTVTVRELQTQGSMLRDTVGVKPLAVCTAEMGLKVPRRAEEVRKSTENSVEAVVVLAVVRPPLSKRAAKALMEASDVRFLLAMWQMMVSVPLLVLFPLQEQQQLAGEVLSEQLLPSRSMTWLISELEALTKKHNRLLSWLARMALLQVMCAFWVVPQVCIVNVTQEAAVAVVNWFSKYPHSTYSLYGSSDSTMRQLLPAMVADMQPTRVSRSELQIWVVLQSLLEAMVIELLFTKDLICERVQGEGMGESWRWQKKKPGTLVTISKLAQVFWVLATLRAKVGATLRAGRSEMVMVVVAVEREYEAELSPPSWAVTGKELVAMVELEQKVIHRSTLVRLNSMVSQLISWCSQNSEAVMLTVSHCRVIYTSDLGGLVSCTRAGMEHPPLGTVMEAGKVITIGVLVTLTAYSLKVLQSTLMEVSRLMRLKVQVVGMRFCEAPMMKVASELPRLISVGLELKVSYVAVKLISMLVWKVELSEGLTVMGSEQVPAVSMMGLQLLTTRWRELGVKVRVGSWLRDWMVVAVVLSRSAAVTITIISFMSMVAGVLGVCREVIMIWNQVFMGMEIEVSCTETLWLTTGEEAETSKVTPPLYWVCTMTGMLLKLSNSGGKVSTSHWLVEMATEQVRVMVKKAVWQTSMFEEVAPVRVMCPQPAWVWGSMMVLETNNWEQSTQAVALEELAMPKKIFSVTNRVFPLRQLARGQGMPKTEIVQVAPTSIASGL